MERRQSIPKLNTMPFPVAAAIGAAATIGGSAINYGSASKTNLRTRQHNEHMFQAQQDANIRNWNMQNEYNSPAATMKRLKEAGLNPALVYGQGSTGSNASPIPQADYKAWNPDTPNVDPGAIGNAISNFREIAQYKLQQSLLQQNLKNEQAKEHLIDAQTSDTLAGVELKGVNTKQAMSNLDLWKRQDEEGLHMGTARSKYQATSTQAELSHLDLEEKKTFQKLSQEEQRARIEEIRARIKNMGQEYRLKEFDENLQKQGINPKASWGTDYWQQLRKFFNYLKGG